MTLVRVVAHVPLDRSEQLPQSPLDPPATTNRIGQTVDAVSPHPDASPRAVSQPNKRKPLKKLRIMVLIREGLEPPDSLEGYTEKQIAEWKAEFDVIHTLREMGHEVTTVGVYDDLSPIRKTIVQWKPHIAFMLLEEFHGVGVYDHAVVGYLELMRQRYTGCNPRGLMLSHDKALAKKLLAFHHVPTPAFHVYPVKHRIHRNRGLTFPLVVKSVIEDASLGISQASIVHTDEALLERVKFVHATIGSDAMVEQYVEGRELYVGVIGNRRLETFPIWEMRFEKMPADVAPIATARVKWNPEYQEKYGITTGPAEKLSENLRDKIERVCKKVYRVLNMSGYARMDLRLTEDDRIFILEANANPNLEYGEDFSES